MSSNIELVSESFSGTQLSIAVGIQEKEIGRIEAETIGWKWNARQKHMLHILGVRALHADDGNDIEPLTVKTFEDIFVEEMEVTLPTIQADIKALEDVDMIEKPYLNGSKKTKKVQLTESGFSLWQEYANKRAALVYAMHEALNKTGGLPDTWGSKIGKWVTLLVGDKAKAAAVAFICLGFTGTLNEAKADFTSPATFVVQNAVFADIHTGNAVNVSFNNYQNEVVAAAEWNNDVSVMVKLQATSTDALALSKATNTDFYTTLPSFKIASTEGLYDQLLPKFKAKMIVTNDEDLTSNGQLTSTWGWRSSALKSVYIGGQQAIDVKPFASYWTQNTTENAAFSVPFKVADTEGLYDRLLLKTAASTAVNYSQ